MKVKVSTLVTAINILKNIDVTQMKLSTSYKVRQVLTTCQDAIDGFEARRIQLAEKHGTLNESGEQYIFEGDEAKERFQKGLQDLLSDEIDLKVDKIPVALLDEYISIEPANVPSIEWFISGLK